VRSNKPRNVAHSSGDIAAQKDEPFGTGVLNLIQINHEPGATIFQFIILMFV
jgi:hypothetical protein